MKHSFILRLASLVFLTFPAMALKAAPLTLTVDTSQLKLQGHDNCGFVFSVTRVDQDPSPLTAAFWTNSVNNTASARYNDGSPVNRFTLYVKNPDTDYVKLNFGNVSDTDFTYVYCNEKATFIKPFPVPAGACSQALHDGAKLKFSGTIDKDGNFLKDYQCHVS